MRFPKESAVVKYYKVYISRATREREPSMAKRYRKKRGQPTTPKKKVPGFKPNPGLKAGNKPTWDGTVCMAIDDNGIECGAYIKTNSKRICPRCGQRYDGKAECPGCRQLFDKREMVREEEDGEYIYRCELCALKKAEDEAFGPEVCA